MLVIRRYLKFIVCGLSVFINLFYCSIAVAGEKIGIAFPTQNQERWYKEGFHLSNLLKKEGYDVELYFGGDNDANLQVRQVGRLINSGCRVLIISAIDGDSFSEVLKEAKKKHIPVISYDHLIMNTDAAEYYVTFDNYAVGLSHGHFIEKKLNLKNTTEIKYIELFTGSLDDNNTHFFWEGAMSVLTPYIQNGTLVVKSGEKSLETCATQGWDREIAMKRMESLIKSQGYLPEGSKGSRIDAVLSPNDSIGNGIIRAFENAGFTEKNIPVITGQDGELEAVKNIHKGLLGMTIFKDANILCDRVVRMTNQLVNKQDVEINDNETYNNGKILEKTFMCEVTVVDKSNYKKVFVDSGLIDEKNLD